MEHLLVKTIREPKIAKLLLPICFYFRASGMMKASEVILDKMDTRREKNEGFNLQFTLNGTGCSQNRSLEHK